MSDDARIIRAVLEQDGARKNSPVLQALDRLEQKAARFDWVLPVIAGNDEELANDRTLKLAQAMMLGLKGEAIVDKAMQT